MLWILESPASDPHDNLALEEFCFRNSGLDGEILLLYVNSPAVVIGRHQNPWAEVDMGYAMRKGIPVVRRISGGGAVYHDRGNLNLCFIGPFHRGRRFAARRLFDPLIDLLRENGLPVRQNRRNDLMVNGRKVSGNAQYTDLHRWLVHATLLVDTDLGDLIRVLAGSIRPQHSLAVGSRRTEVGNVAPSSNPFQASGAWKQELARRYAAADTVSPLSLDALQQRSVFRLAMGKYRSRDWNIAKTPAFSVCGTLRLPEEHYPVVLRVERGDVTAAEIADANRLDTRALSMERLPDKRFEILFESGTFVPPDGSNEGQGSLSS
ncbi:MAG: lipoate--protein ligase family protein [Desulfobacteraceae bacterium]|nr:lipoate--protein ligase family protein [Desulfobacteraceae bacterium]